MNKKHIGLHALFCAIFLFSACKKEDLAIEQMQTVQSADLALAKSYYAKNSSTGKLNGKKINFTSEKVIWEKAKLAPDNAIIIVPVTINFTKKSDAAEFEKFLVLKKSQKGIERGNFITLVNKKESNNNEVSEMSILI